MLLDGFNGCLSKEMLEVNELGFWRSIFIPLNRTWVKEFRTALHNLMGYEGSQKADFTLTIEPSNVSEHNYSVHYNIISNDAFEEDDSSGEFEVFLSNDEILMLLPIINDHCGIKNEIEELRKNIVSTLKGTNSNLRDKDYILVQDSIYGNTYVATWLDADKTSGITVIAKNIRESGCKVYPVEFLLQ